MAPTTSDLQRDDSRMLAVNGLVDVLVGQAPRRIQRPRRQWADIVSVAARPGTGGRRKRVDLGFEIEATAICANATAGRRKSLTADRCC
jgi:hypothetical protein